MPLFQDKGTLVNENGKTYIKNITAAALPRANTGMALGNTKDPLETLFARLRLKKQNIQINPEFEISINAFPAAGGVEASAEDLLVLDDPNRKDSWVLKINPKQQHVGKHLISIKSKSNEDIRKNIVIDVVNVNDAPLAIDNEELDYNQLNINAKEGEAFEHGKPIIYR